MNAQSKVTARHLQLSAYLYVRQSTLRQVIENTESTQRQYAMRQQAISLGWREDQIVVIDHDQGQSAASVVDREGFQRLVADVGLGKGGIVMGLEASRLARNCADWHRLLEICALTGTLILDEDGLYDPGHFNDRLLLGLKGTMSEAELHLLKARLLGGRLSKAQRGELRLPLPAGLVYDPLGRVSLDPDLQVRNALRMFFDTFHRTGSAWKCVQEFARLALRFPGRRGKGPAELLWQELTHSRALATLHNPRYAGVFCYGRTRSWKGGEGQQHCERVPEAQWRFFKPDAHPGYISWEQFQANQQRLRDNYQAYGGGRKDTARTSAGPAREGPGLLQGLVVCGRCGRSMILRYTSKKGLIKPIYVCEHASIERCKPICQRVPGSVVDEALGKVLVQSASPLAMEVALEVQAEVEGQLAQADRIRRQHVERAQYEADQAKLRYMKVDAGNRLVADTLEREWNEKLRVLAEASRQYEVHRLADHVQLNAAQKERIRSLASDFPKLWSDPKTSNRDRKRMLRLLIEDVVLKRQAEEILVRIRFKGGAAKALTLPMPKPAWARRKTSPEVIKLIDRMLDDINDDEVARRLNAKGFRSGMGKEFNSAIVKHLRQDYGLKSHAERLCERGWMTAAQVGALIDEEAHRVYRWRKAGLLEGEPCGERNAFLYRNPSQAVVTEIRRLKGVSTRHQAGKTGSGGSGAV